MLLVGFGVTIVQLSPFSVTEFLPHWLERKLGQPRFHCSRGMTAVSLHDTVCRGDGVGTREDTGILAWGWEHESLAIRKDCVSVRGSCR